MDTLTGSGQTDPAAKIRRAGGPKRPFNRIRMRHSMQRWMVVLAVIAVCTAAGTWDGVAQVPPDKSALLAGDVPGQAGTAEMNGYPGPKQVLEYAKELKLTSAQSSAIAEINKGLVARAKELGKRIVSVEEELNEEFKSGLVSEKSIQETTDQIAKLRGRLRAEYLTAHLKTRALLTGDQLRTYAELRSPKSGKKK